MDGRGQLPGLEASVGHREPGLGLRRGSPLCRGRSVVAGFGRREWGCRPSRPVPFRGFWQRRSGPGQLFKPSRRRCPRLGPGLYLAAREGAGAVPEGASQRPACLSVDRALPRTLPGAVPIPGGQRLPPALPGGQEDLSSAGTGMGHGPHHSSQCCAVGECRSEEPQDLWAESWCPPGAGMLGLAEEACTSRTRMQEAHLQLTAFCPHGFAAQDGTA